MRGSRKRTYKKRAKQNPEDEDNTVSKDKKMKKSGKNTTKSDKPLTRHSGGELNQTQPSQKNMNTKDESTPRSKGLYELMSLNNSSLWFSAHKKQAEFQKKWLFIYIGDSSLDSFKFEDDVWNAFCASDLGLNNFYLVNIQHLNNERINQLKTLYHFRKLPVMLLIDPVTGELLKTFSTLLTADDLYDQLLIFLDKHSLDLPNPEDNKAILVESSLLPTSSLKRHFEPDGSPDVLIVNESSKKKVKEDDSLLADDINLSQSSSHEIMKVAFKLPDGGRKLVEFRHNATISDLKKTISGCNIDGKITVQINPKDQCMLSYSNDVRLTQLGFHDRLLLYITYDA